MKTLTEEEGRIAWKDGLNIHECPYKRGTLEAERWEVGFHEMSYRDFKNEQGQIRAGI